MSVTLGNRYINRQILVDGRDVGTVGYSRDADGVNWVHYEIRNKEDRWRGYGFAAVTQLIEQVLVGAVRVMVRPWNEASLGLARKVGFVEISRDEENVVLELKR